MRQQPVQALSIIVDRGVGEAAAALLRDRGYPIQFVLRGRGTARSEVLHYLGLGETEKDVVLSLVPAPAVSSVLAGVAEAFQLSRHGRGIAFSIPISAVSAMAAKLSRGQAEEKEEEPMETTVPHALILVLVDHGGADQVMEAAWAADATGGTILHSRQLGLGALEGAQDLSAEKEAVAILVPAALRAEVMDRVNQAAGMHTPLHGVLLSLPVHEVAGL